MPKHHRAARSGAGGHRRGDRGRGSPVRPQGQRHHPAVRRPTSTRSRPLSPRSPPRPRGCSPSCSHAGSRRKPFRRCVVPRCARGSIPDVTATLTSPRSRSGARRCTRCSTADRPCCCARAASTRSGSRSTASRFLLFPTVAHSHAERVRPEHRDLLAPPPPTAPTTRSSCGPGAQVVAAVEVNRADGLEEIAPLHIWTAESVRADRLDFRPRHRLTVLVVSGQPAGRAGAAGAHARTTRAARVGCRCRSAPKWATPVHDDATLAEIAAGCAAQSADGGRARRQHAAATHRRRGARCASGRQPACALSSGSPVPRLRANRGCEPPATSTRMREPARNTVRDRRPVRCAPCRRNRVAPRRYPSLTLRERPLASTSLTRDEQVVVRVVARVREFEHRVADDVEVLRQRVAGERQHVGAVGELVVVAVAADGGEQPAADGRRRVRGVVGERRRVRGVGRHRIAEPSARLEVAHAFGHRRRPLIEVEPTVAVHVDPHRLRSAPGCRRCVPSHSSDSRMPSAQPGHHVRVGPRPDGHRDVDVARAVAGTAPASARGTGPAIR